MANEINKSYSYVHCNLVHKSPKTILFLIYKRDFHYKRWNQRLGWLQRVICRSIIHPLNILFFAPIIDSNQVIGWPHLKILHQQVAHQHSRTGRDSPGPDLIIVYSSWKGQITLADSDTVLKSTFKCTCYHRAFAQNYLKSCMMQS